MSVRIMRLPDVGEGVAEAELVAWHVAVGDVVTSDTIVAEVLTDKATVEVYAPVAGTVRALHGEPGDVLAVGSDFVEIESGDGADPTPEPAAAPAAAPTIDTDVQPSIHALAAPAVRERARALGVGLSDIRGTGPDGRVTHADLDRHVGGAPPGASTGSAPASAATTQIPVIGVRRRIAQQVAASASSIPHITYVEEIDATELERLRDALTTAHPDQPRVTVLPFVIRAIVLAVADQPQLNATFDDETQVLTTFEAVHVGIATQTPNGLVVPVVHDAQTMDLWQTAAELTRVTTAARAGTATRGELSGSTVSITSLGALGGLVTTPIINRPEVAIVGINKMQIRPLWDGATFVPRTMMNLSSSFDHRIVDGWDAATFIQRIKTLLEMPALLFTPAPGGSTSV